MPEHTVPGRPVAPAADAAFDPSRRRALRLFGAGVVATGLYAGGVRSALAAPTDARTLTFHHTHTLETLRVEYCRSGTYCERGLGAIARVLRDHRTGDVHPIDTQLLDLLHDVAARAERDAEFEVISGYRSPRTNAKLQSASGGVATRSLHLEGRAIDVRLVGSRLGDLRDNALALKRGGVGYYPGSRFVHVDTGRFRTWSG